VTNLEKSLAGGDGKTDGFDLYVLAMCHHHLSKAKQARAYFDRAIQWRNERINPSPRWIEELDAFHSEAAALLLPQLPKE
jgi:hypothetical protein